MHDVRVINPLCHFFQQPVVPDIVKVGSQVKVEDARLPLDNCLGYSLDRVMCCPLGPISKRSRLEIRLENRVEYELERTLHHPVPKRQDGSAFALTYILRLRSCNSMDAFVLSSLPSPMLEALQMAGPLRSTDITPLHR